MKQIIYNYEDIADISAGGDAPEEFSNVRTKDFPYPIFSNGLENEGLYGYGTKKRIKGDTVTVSARGVNIGTVFYRKESFLPIVRLISLEPNEKVFPKYLFYYLKGARIIGTGSAQPQIPVPYLRRQKVKIFEDVNYQKKIANVLSKYDDLIELNNKRIKLLEQTAQEIYKEWFVRFRFPGYESACFENGIPKGWERKKLQNIAKEVGEPEKKENRDDYDYYLPIDCIDGFSMSLSHVDIIENAESSLISFDRGDILFGAMRPYFHKVVIAPFKGLTRTTCFVINAKEKEYRNYLYLLLNENASVNYATTVSVGSTMPYTRWKDFNRMNIIVPDKKTILKFNNIIEPILKRIVDAYFINQNIIKQRDLLLPRLMSGKLEV